MSTVVVEKLRCTHCGAPLPQPRPGEQYVKCEYCGFVNRVSDSAGYTEYLKREVAKWVSQLIPHQIVVSTVADPVARHHVFQAYVKPRLIPVSVNARTRFIETVYRPLLVLNPVYKPDCADPKTLFEESVRVESISELAVSDEDRSFIGDVQRSLLVTAYVCNAVVDAAVEKYAESARNLDEALKLLDKYEDKVLTTRLGVAKSYYTALAELNSRNPTAPLDILKYAESVLEDLSKGVGDPNLTRHAAALETEKDLVKIAKALAELSYVYFEQGRDPLAPIPAARKALVYTAENAVKAGRPVKDVVAVAETWVQVVQARAGRRQVKVLGDGDFYIPFYTVSTSITFTSGLLFKKGLETRVEVLVSAVPPVLQGLVDVFGVYTGKPVNLEKEQDRLTIPSRLVETARLDYLRKPAALPLISPLTAEHIVDRYLDVARSRYGGKVKLATTHVRELVFLGAVVEASMVKTQIPLTVFSLNTEKLKNIMV